MINVIVAPMLSGKSTFLRARKPGSSPLVLDTDMLADHKGLIERYGHPEAHWDSSQWRAWNTARRAQIVTSLMNHLASAHRGRAIFLLTHNYPISYASDFDVTTVAFVLIPDSTFFERCSTATEQRASLARKNRAEVLDESATYPLVPRTTSIEFALAGAGYAQR